MDLNLEIVMCKCGTIISEDTSVREPFQETHSIDKLFIKSSKFNDSPLIHRTMHNRQFLIIFQRALSLLIIRRHSSAGKILQWLAKSLIINFSISFFSFQRVTLFYFSTKSQNLEFFHFKKRLFKKIAPHIATRYTPTQIIIF